MLSVVETCLECGGDGGFEVPTGSYSHINGDLHTRWQRCDHCDGTGSVEVPIIPAGIERIEEMDDGCAS